MGKKSIIKASFFTLLRHGTYKVYIEIKMEMSLNESMYLSFHEIKVDN